MTTFTQSQYDLLGALPENEDAALTYHELADVLDIELTTIRDRMSSLRDTSVDIGVDASEKRNRYYLEGGIEHPTNANPSFQEQTRNKQRKSKIITSHFTQLETRLHDALNETQPAVADGGHPVRAEHEDVVIHRTDSHFGDEETDEFGNEVFDSGILAQREKQVVDRTMEVIDEREALGVEYDTVHYLLGGDMVTGEATFRNQQAEIRETLDEQLDGAYGIYIDQIQRLSERFPAVQVVCQPGNHGALEGSYSDGANADRLLYMMIDKSIRMSDMDNVTVIRNDSTEFTNFYARGNRQTYDRHGPGRGGWKFHLRHGDESLEHIGTSAGKRRWYNWMLRHGFDQAYRGHYHTFQLDTIHGDTKVLMTGSPKPPEDYEEALAEWTTPTATVHGVSDEKPFTWMEPITFSL